MILTFLFTPQNNKSSLILSFKKVCLAASEVCREEDAAKHTRLVYKYKDLCEGLRGEFGGEKTTDGNASPFDEDNAKEPGENDEFFN